MDGRTMDGKVESTAGGVGRNLADCLARLGQNPFLISNVGAQEHAHTLLSKMDHVSLLCLHPVPRNPIMYLSCPPAPWFLASVASLTFAVFFPTPDPLPSAASV
ncbi:hypothetical protein CDAR_275271 [Caerostris darwini]|uniref:Carbohydrate kinase PfkB domain-containing protein n=1 Tax=Caerostris darwini TaxID=1538125 RepID=A0AAV4VF65_9ARAC|nr:hypothetical protein CDAR_275271 [Caerostris darwini]